jgi:hypothetical protein
MPRTLLLLNGLAIAIAATGITLLVRPAFARGLLRLPDSEPASYALRMIGAMLFAAALFLAGFSTAYHLASAP